MKDDDLKALMYIKRIKATTCPSCGEKLNPDVSKKVWLECSNQSCPVIRVHLNGLDFDVVQRAAVM